MFTSIVKAYGCPFKFPNIQHIISISFSHTKEWAVSDAAHGGADDEANQVKHADLV